METGFALIGAGLWGKIHASVYSRHSNVRFVGVCDVVEERAKAMARKYGAQKWYTDFNEMLDDPSITAVSVATPDLLHTAPVVAAAKKGKHVLVEKPLATSISDAQSMVNAARDSNVKLMVDFHNRWNPAFAAAKAAIENGEVGDPTLIYMRHSNTKFVPMQMLKWSGESSVLWFLGSHSIDLVRWLFNDEVERVYCVSRGGVLKKLGRNTPDFFESILEFKGGGVGVVENVWILPDSMSTLGDFKCELIGTEGSQYVDFTGNRAYEKYTKDKGTFPDLLAAPVVHGEMVGFVLESIKHFVDCVCLDKPLFATGEDGSAVTRIICGLLESIKTRTPIELSSLPEG